MTSYVNNIIYYHDAALTPANIQNFFEDVQNDAERISAWYEFCAKNQTQDKGVSLFSVPTITVRIIKTLKYLSYVSI